MTDLDLVRLQLASAFIFDAQRRIVAHNDPMRSPTTFKAQFSGCALGNMCCFTADVDATRAREVERLFRPEPPLSGYGQEPVHLAEYVRILLGDVEPANASISLNWHLPNEVAFFSDARVVRSGTVEGEALLDRFRRDRVQRSLFDMGFVNTDEFWPPWCAVFCGGEIAALGFSARLGEHAADLGLVTVPEFRRRGFGAAAAAAWAAHPALAGHTLFYSTRLANRSSQRVVERLGLRLIGSGCQIG